MTAALQAFFYTIPAGCFALSAFFACRAPITAFQHFMIREQIRARAGGKLPFYDPLTLEQLFPTGTHRRSRRVSFSMEADSRPDVLESFDDAEQEEISSGESGMARLACRWYTDLILTVGIILFLSIYAGSNSTAVMVAVGLVMRVIYVALKLATFSKEQAFLKQHANKLRFQGAVNGGGKRAHEGGFAMIDGPTEGVSLVTLINPTSHPEKYAFLNEQLRTWAKRARRVVRKRNSLVAQQQQQQQQQVVEEDETLKAMGRHERKAAIERKAAMVKKNRQSIG